MLLHTFPVTFSSSINRNCGFISNIDILVCTPGRLVEHIASTDGFSLEYLRFLIIDEADCLLSQSYHHWLEKIYDAVDNSNTRNSSHIRYINNFVIILIAPYLNYTMGDVRDL